jgi:flagellar assembly protein FliH
MMNMSSEKNPSGSSAPLVEAFHYPQAPLPGSAATYLPALGGEGNLASEVRTSSDPLALRIAKAREEGIREGEQRGRNKLEQEMAEQRARIAEALAGFERERAEYYSKIEAEVVHLAVAIAAKILHREARVDRMLLAALVRVALEKLQQKTRVVVRVTPQQAEAWRQYFAQSPQMAVSPEIVEDSSLGPWNCTLETELGSTELGLEPQLKEVEAGLFDLLAQRPDAPPQQSKSGFARDPGAR